MAAKYADVAQFLIIYIKEAHPSDDWAMRVNPRLKYIKDPTNLFERFQVASTCMTDLKLSIPCLIDDMENTAARAYRGWPDRLYVIGKDGKIVFHGEPGPWGFQPDVMEKSLIAELKVIGSYPSEKKKPEKKKRWFRKNAIDGSEISV